MAIKKSELYSSLWQSCDELRGGMDASQYISPLNFNSTVILIRELKKDELADELIDFYIQARKNETELFNLSQNHFIGGEADPIIKSRFEQQYSAASISPTLIEAVSAIAKNRGWSNDEIQILEKASEDDFYNLFKRDHDIRLSSIVKACFIFEGQVSHQSISQKARAALVRIGHENQLNALRVRRYGIEVPEISNEGY